MKKTRLQRLTPFVSGPSKKLKRGPLAKANPKRKAKTFTRAYGGAERADWMTHQPCLVCGALPSVSAHVGPKGSKGTGYKADARWTVPLCPPHHDEHHHGQRSFEAAHHIDLLDLAAIVDARWEQHCAALSPGEARTTRSGETDERR